MSAFDSKDIILITGASSGIGRQVCQDLNKSGAFVIAVAKDTHKLESLHSEIEFPNNFAIEQKDLSTEPEKLDIWIKDISKKYGKLYGLGLIAGIQNISPVSGIKSSILNEILNVNLLSNIYLSKGFIDKRVNRGNGSSIVFMSSISAIKGEAGLSMYSTTKGGLNSFAKSLAKESAPHGIRVNTILAGLVKTDLIKKWSSIYTAEYLDKAENDYPLGISSPEDISSKILFLLSNKSSKMTGSEILVDGGITL